LLESVPDGRVIPEVTRRRAAGRETARGYRGVATAGASSSAMTEYFEDDFRGAFADVLDGRRHRV
jgi:hypothetical protein